MPPPPFTPPRKLGKTLDTLTRDPYNPGTPNRATGPKEPPMETVTLIATAVLACIGCSFGGYGLGILKGLKAAGAKPKATKAE